MLDWLARLLHVSPTVAGLVLALIVVQLATQVYALVDLARRDAVRGDRKWVWALVIAFGNLPGAIVYLAAGRPAGRSRRPGGRIRREHGGRRAARRAVDALYGPRDQR